MRSSISVEDLRKELSALGYERGTSAEIDKALRRLGKICAERLDRIPAELDSFDRRFGGLLDVLSLGFRSAQAFSKWRSLVRGALKRVEGLAERRRTAEDRCDNWHLITRWVFSESGINSRFGTNRRLVLHTLVERARMDALSPKGIDATWCEAQRDALSYERRKAFVRGLRFLNDIVRQRETLPRAIAEVIPSTPLPLPPPSRSRHINIEALPPSFAKDLGEFERWYLWRDRDQRLERLAVSPGISPASVKAYRSAIGWLTRELIESGMIHPEQIVGLHSICRADLIFEAAIRFSRRRADPNSGLSRESSSLHSYVSKVGFVAANWVRVDDDERRAIKSLLSQRAVRTARVGMIAADREAFVRRLAQDPMLQRSVLLMPDKLIAEADRLFVDWSERPPSVRMRCIRLAMAACQSAILLRTMPVRATNLRTLRFRGADATLVFPKARNLSPRLVIPPAQVKNERHLEATVTPTSLPILKKWLDCYRPLMIERHPYGHAIKDSDFVFPGISETEPIDASTAAYAFASGVAHVGLDLTQHECRHAIACLVLRRDPTKLQVVADWLGDDPRTIRKHYMFMDTERAADLGQSDIALMLADARIADVRGSRGRSA